MATSWTRTPEVRIYKRPSQPLRRRWPQHNLLFTICLLNTLNYMDRFVVAALLPLIQHHFSLTDDLGGLLHTSFILAYTSFFAVFIYLAPYFQPYRMIFNACAFWLVLSLTSAFVTRYWVLLYMRMLVACCEACFAAAASLLFMQIAYKQPNSAARWLLFYYSTSPLGCAFGYIASGCVLHKRTEYGWRWCLGVVPILLCLALLVLCCTDKPVGELLNPKQRRCPALGNQLRQLYQIPSYALAITGFACAHFISSAFNWWLPSYLYRSFHLQKWHLQDVILKLGGINAAIALFGVLLGANLSQLAHRSGRKALDPVLCGGSVLVSLPCLLLVLYHASLNVHLTLFFASVSQLALNVYPAVALDMTLCVVPLNRRTLAWTMHTIIVQICGEATSPYIVGLLAQLFQHYEMVAGQQLDTNRGHIALQRALLLIIFVHMLGTIFFLWTAFFIERDRRHVQTLPLDLELDSNELPPINTLITMRSLLELSVGRNHRGQTRIRI